MKKPILPLVLAGAILVSSFACSCTAPAPGQLAASELAPLVETVTQDFEAYIDLGIGLDGEPSSEAERFRMRGGVVALRNAIHAGLDEELEPLPVYEVPVLPEAEEE